MFKKRYLFILVPVVLLIVIGAIFRIQIVEGCRNAWSSDRPGYAVYSDCHGGKAYHPLIYQRIEFSSPDDATVYITDGTNDMTCFMQWKGSKWVKTGGLTTIVAPCP